VPEEAQTIECAGGRDGEEFLGRGGGLVVIGAGLGGAGVDRYWHLGNFGGRR